VLLQGSCKTLYFAKAYWVDCTEAVSFGIEDERLHLLFNFHKLKYVMVVITPGHHCNWW